MRKQRSCLEERQCKEQCQVHTGEENHARPRWTTAIYVDRGLSVEESIRMTEDRDKWRKYVHGVANPRIKND